MKRILFLLFLFQVHFLQGQITICSGTSINVSTTGYESSTGYVQNYILVNGAGTIITHNTSGNFSSTDYGASYFGSLSIYAVNTNDGTLISSATGNTWANFATSINATCADLIGPVNYVVDNCQAITICSGDDIVVSTTGYTSSSGYQQLYVMVDSTTNAIISFNSTGNFTASDYGSNTGTFSIYALNTNDNNLITQLNTQTWTTIESNAIGLCADIIGPKYYHIDICCDLTASTVTTHESCENENDGEITLTINGTSNYNVSVNGTLNLNAVSQGNYNIQNLSDGAYALYITDNAFNNCDTSINNSINPGNPTHNIIIDTSICNGSTIVINGFAYGGFNPTGTQNLTTIYGCDSILNITVSQNPPISSFLGTTICSNDTLIVNGTIYDINNSNGQEIFTALNGCDSTVNVNLSFNTAPTVFSNFTDTTVCEDDTITLYGIGANSYVWNNNIIDNVPVIAPETGLYIVTGTDSMNCSNSYQFQLNTVFCPREPYSILIPNIFTPNSDGENDLFKVKGTSFELITMKIFNRWGQLLFEDEIGTGWDGRLPSGMKASAGNYLYFISIQPLTIPPSEIENYEGFLQLIDQ